MILFAKSMIKFEEDTFVLHNEEFVKSSVF